MQALDRVYRLCLSKRNCHAVISSSLHGHPILHLLSQPVFLFDNRKWQLTTKAKEHEQCPLPSEWIDNDRKCEPIDELTIGEEVKGAAR